MSEMTGHNGAKIIINLAPFDDAMNLKNKIGSELAKQGIDLKNIGINSDSDVADILPAVLNGFLTIDSSEVVIEAIFKCLNRCTYDGEKITRQTFESAENRADYYAVVIECVKENLSPFFAGLASKLSANGLSLEKILK